MASIPLLPIAHTHFSVYITDAATGKFDETKHKPGQIIKNEVKSIQICPKSESDSLEIPYNAPKDALVQIIQNFPNVERLILSGNFDTTHTWFLNPLISFLGRNRLNLLQTVEFLEIKKVGFSPHLSDEYQSSYEFGATEAARAKALNSRCLRAIGHVGLENVSIKSLSIDSNLTGDEIQPVLDNSPNLKTFAFNGFQSDQTVSLSFAQQPELSKVQLNHWRGAPSTIESLKACKKL